MENSIAHDACAMLAIVLRARPAAL